MKLQQLLENEDIQIEDGRIVSKHTGKHKGNFYCRRKRLISLEGCPTSVSGDFDCYDNLLTSLEGCPTSIKGSFNCYVNELTSLEYCPSSVGKYFSCGYNQLTSLEYCPSSVGKYFSCSNNKLTSLEYCPSSVGGDFNCEDNQLTSLEGIHKHIKKMNGYLWVSSNPIKSHVLGVFLIQGCNEIKLDNKDVEKIINKYLQKGRDGLIDCQNELIEVGFEDFAQI